MFHGFLTTDDDVPVNLKYVEFILQLIALRTHLKTFPCFAYKLLVFCEYITLIVFAHFSINKNQNNQLNRVASVSLLFSPRKEGVKLRKET